MTPEPGVELVALGGASCPGGRPRFLADLERLRLRAERSARCPVALSVALMDDAEIRRHNAALLDHDWPTDVITVPMETRPVLAGELLISVETARREAALRGHPPYHELLLYAVHGTLHLLGHEDGDAAAKRRMRAAERRWLGGLGLPAVFGRGRSKGDSR